MTLIQGYLFRQIGLPVVAACAALAGIGLLSQSLDQLEVIVERGQSIWVMAKLTLLTLPQLIAVILPIGLFVGALIALTRLQREQELTAAYAAGVSRWSLIRPAIRIAVIVAVAALVTNVFVQPWAQREARRQAFAIRTDLAALLVEEGQFVQGPGGLTVYVQQIEQIYSRRILDMLEPLVGKQNVKAQVTAELDFSQTESTTESHKPNQTVDSSAVRSQQLVESINGAQPTQPAGIPGATTNQPPAQAAAPINTGDLRRPQPRRPHID